jgi:hypothetical protein
MSSDEKTGRGVEEAMEAEAAKAPEYLLVEVAGRHAAVPLADVLRIEQLKVSRIEYIGYRAVLNFEGQLLPVEDSGGVLAAVADRSSWWFAARAAGRWALRFRTCWMWPREKSFSKLEPARGPAE